MSEETERPPAHPLPGHDIFCTPENSEFYSHMLYNDLDPTRREIRLLKILPDSGSGLIEGELLPKAPVTDLKGQYFALSYCAGDVRQTDAILVNGLKFNVFANLKHALTAAQRFRNKEIGDDDFLLWVDQICIDQSNLPERSHQVGFMRDIYQSARQTLICLSTSEIEGEGMRWLVELDQNVPPREDDVDSNIPIGFVAPPPSWTHPGFSPERFRWQRVENFLRDNVWGGNFTDGWIALFDVLKSPWWSRAWVFQELMVSVNAVLMFGHHMMSWKNASYILQVCHRVHWFLLSPSLRSTGSIPGLPSKRLFHRIVKHVHGSECREAIKTVAFMIQTKLNWAGEMDIKHLLEYARYCKASDDRDRVYAFLGLADAGYRVIPDYSPDNDVIQVLIETTKNIIIHEDSLNILAQAAAPASRQKDALPSWVADWTRKDVSDVRDLKTGLSRWIDKNEVGIPSLFDQVIGVREESPHVSFRDIRHPDSFMMTTALEVRGVFIDTISDKGGGREVLEHHRAFPFETTRGYTFLSTPVVNLGDEMWWLCGMSTPVVLERRAYGYRLIGYVMFLRQDYTTPKKCREKMVSVDRQLITIV
ncbi:Heterokaryon incompatibility 6 OR allele [Fusarium albosuccineum]|uniref:Heterokaryon incompatibility 6 OR allele n=1 Tax=Fusarium albosuccineum TaxID=1237068 RepID=A0A8H4LLH1_9HYPO|nr:Heterokaryon incompatibility 6 OR allele [Fusarium albosuccineum]